jgi:single-stranded-DNA-specific exonuclease
VSEGRPAELGEGEGARSRGAFDVGPFDELVASALDDPGPAPPSALGLARDERLSLTAADVLARRGLTSGDALRSFLAPKLAALTPPEPMLDRELAALRLARAVRAGERVVVFGDYDCDGITATAIVTGILRALGGDVVPLLASRREGHYGLSEPAVRRVLEARPTLVVTCDCGSSDHARLEALRARGVDTIVIDHHLVPSDPLPALAFLNPHRPECGFAYKGLASCGLALSVGGAVRKALGRELDLRPWLDLVAIGTIADVAPLDGDNRALVRAGLGVLARGSRPGLRALAQCAKLELGRGVTAEDVAFRIAPRLNAPGRLADPDPALALLLETNEVAATALAGSVEHVTLERRRITEETLQAAIRQVLDGGFERAPAIVVGHADWHPGIVGIVAGRLTSMFGKPSIVVALEGAVGRGSVRGPGGARLYDALVSCRDVLVAFGGHQAAAGVTVEASRLEALRDRFAEAFAARPQAASLASATARLDAGDEPHVVVHDLAQLEPCGEGNPAPLLFVGGARVRSSRNLKGHLKLELAVGRSVLPAFVGGRGELAERLVDARLDLVAKLRADRFRGGDAVELGLVRLAPARA